MKKVIFLLFVLVSGAVFASMGYLGGHPYTVNTDTRRQKFNVTPPPPAPSRRAQYAFMAEEKALPMIEDEIIQDDPIQDDSFDEAEKEDEFLDDSADFDEPSIVDDSTDEVADESFDEDYIDFSEF